MHLVGTAVMSLSMYIHVVGYLHGTWILLAVLSSPVHRAYLSIPSHNSTERTPSSSFVPKGMKNMLNQLQNVSATTTQNLDVIFPVMTAHELHMCTAKCNSNIGF